MFIDGTLRDKPLQEQQSKLASVEANLLLSRICHQPWWASELKKKALSSPAGTMTKIKRDAWCLHFGLSVVANSMLQTHLLVLFSLQFNSSWVYNYFFIFTLERINLLLFWRNRRQTLIFLFDFRIHPSSEGLLKTQSLRSLHLHWLFGVRICHL